MPSPRADSREQDLDYLTNAATAFVPPKPAFAQPSRRLLYRTRFYRFYFYPPLYLALLAFLITGIRDVSRVWIALTALLFALGVNFFPEFQFHYMAAVVCLFVLMSVEGLRRIAEWPGGAAAARVLIYLCIAQFTFWYSVHLLDRHDFALAMERYDNWDSINQRSTARRIPKSTTSLRRCPASC